MLQKWSAKTIYFPLAQHLPPGHSLFFRASTSAFRLALALAWESACVCFPSRHTVQPGFENLPCGQALHQPSSLTKYLFRGHALFPLPMINWPRPSIVPFNSHDEVFFVAGNVVVIDTGNVVVAAPGAICTFFKCCGRRPYGPTFGVGGGVCVGARVGNAVG